jgi:hypothetical protein
MTTSSRGVHTSDRPGIHQINQTVSKKKGKGRKNASTNSTSHDKYVNKKTGAGSYGGSVVFSANGS